MANPFDWTPGQTAITIADHNTRHENAGADEISVAGLSGLLADDQHVLDAEVTAVAVAHALATAANDFLIASGSGAFVKKTLTETITILGLPQFTKAMVAIDLSGGAVSAIPILHTSRAVTLLKAIILYTEASSADAGVLLEIGKEADADYYYTGNSEASKALWYELDVTLLQTAITAGDTILCGCAGGKIGTGEVLICIEFKLA